MTSTIPGNLSEITNATLVVKALTKYGIGNWKNPGGTDKEQKASGDEGPGHHSYGAVYQALIQLLKSKGKIASVVEIGVQRGGSILLWQHLCPKAFVIGLDIAYGIDKAVADQIDNKRFEFIEGNAYSPKSIEAVAKQFPDGVDLLIDDGPHTLKSQLDFLQMYLPLLADGGYAVIEDIDNVDYLKRLVEAVPAGYTCEPVDRRYVNGRWDDLMLVIGRQSV